MSRLLPALLRLVHRVEDALLVAMLALMIGIAVTQIVLRNGFDGGLLWGDAFLRVLVLWIGLAGALVASRDRRHISIDVVGRFLPAVAARAASALTSLFTAVVCAALGWYALEFVKVEYEAPTLAFGTVPTWACAAIMPFGFGLMALRFFVQALMAPPPASPPGAVS
ncbi:MAG: TRAP transporter small permease [Moraxellaceae bacterium]